MRLNFHFCFSALVAALLAACGSPNRVIESHDPNKSGKLIMETPTRGTATIVVDETLMPILEEMETVFEFQRPETDVILLSLPEREAYNSIETDTVRLVVGTRKLSETERHNLEARSFRPDEVLLAHDAVALVANKQNPVRRLTRSQIKDILGGKIKKWSEMDPTFPSTEIVLVFDHAESGTARYVAKEVLNGPISTKVYSAKTNPGVLEYLQTNPSALGIVGMNWVCNVDDSLTEAILEKVIPLELEAPDSSSRKGEFFGPYQAHVAAGNYPLTRPVYGVLREPFLGVGTGFVNFIAGETGQRIFLKAGLPPARVPMRNIELRDVSIDKIK